MEKQNETPNEGEGEKREKWQAVRGRMKHRYVGVKDRWKITRGAE